MHRTCDDIRQTLHLPLGTEDRLGGNLVPILKGQRPKTGASLGRLLEHRRCDEIAKLWLIHPAAMSNRHKAIGVWAPLSDAHDRWRSARLSPQVDSLGKPPTPWLPAN